MPDPGHPILDANRVDGGLKTQPISSDEWRLIQEHRALKATRQGGDGAMKLWVEHLLKDLRKEVAGLHPDNDPDAVLPLIDRRLEALRGGQSPQ